MRAAGIGNTVRDTVVNMNAQHLGKRAVTIFESLADAGLRTAAVNFTAYRGRTHHRATVPFLGTVSAPERFFHTNVDGTRRVLDAAEQAGTELVVHVSTDEVYGPCTAEPFREQDKLEGEGAATSAYARSKALADDLALSRSGRLGVIVARPTNCFGQWQHPEKAIPRWTPARSTRKPTTSGNFAASRRRASRARRATRSASSGSRVHVSDPISR